MNKIFMGWKCPECGRIFSPYLHTCPHCTGEEKYSKPTDTKEEKEEKKYGISKEILAEWQFGPAEGGE